MRPPAIPRPPLYGFRFGEVVWSNPGGTYPVTKYRVVGPGLRARTLTVAPASRSIADSIADYRGPFADVLDLFHDTPAYYSWVELEQRDEQRMLPRRGKPMRHGPVSGLRAAIEALISDNPHLCIVRDSWEGGRPHSRAACLHARLWTREAGTPAQVEATIRTVIDTEVLDCIRANSAILAASSDMEVPWLSDEDKAILGRVAEFRR